MPQRPGLFSGWTFNSQPAAAPSAPPPSRPGLFSGFQFSPQANALSSLFAGYVPPTATANVLASQQPQPAPAAPQANALAQQTPAAPQAHQNSFLDNLMFLGGVPVHERSFVQAMMGRKEPITERDLTPDEQQQLSSVIATARRDRAEKLAATQRPDELVSAINLAKKGLAEDPIDGLHTLDDADVPGRVAFLQQQLTKAQKVQGTKAWFDQGNGTIGELDDYLNSGDGKALNTAMALHNTLGRATYTSQPDGTREVKDTYDFWNEDRAPQVQRYQQMSPLQKLGSVLFDGSQDPQLSSRIGNAYIGARGIPVDIKLKPPR